MYRLELNNIINKYFNNDITNNILSFFKDDCIKCDKIICSYCYNYPYCDINGGCILGLRQCHSCLNNFCATCQYFCPMCCSIFCTQCYSDNIHEFIHPKEYLCGGCIICLNCKDKHYYNYNIHTCTKCMKIMYGCCDPWWCANSIEYICYDCLHPNIYY